MTGEQGTPRRPQSLARSLPDLKSAFEATRRFLRATPLKPPKLEQASPE
jgi:hypothetical protein